MGSHGTYKLYYGSVSIRYNCYFHVSAWPGPPDQTTGNLGLRMLNGEQVLEVKDRDIWREFLVYFPRSYLFIFQRGIDLGTWVHVSREDLFTSHRTKAQKCSPLSLSKGKTGQVCSYYKLPKS